MIYNYIVMSCGIVLFNQASMKIKQVTLLLTMFILYQGALVIRFRFARTAGPQLRITW